MHPTSKQMPSCTAHKPEMRSPAVMAGSRSPYLLPAIIRSRSALIRGRTMLDYPTLSPKFMTQEFASSRGHFKLHSDREKGRAPLAKFLKSFGTLRGVRIGGAHGLSQHLDAVGSCS